MIWPLLGISCNVSSAFFGALSKVSDAAIFVDRYVTFLLQCCLKLSHTLEKTQDDPEARKRMPRVRSIFSIVACSSVCSVGLGCRKVRVYLPRQQSNVRVLVGNYCRTSRSPPGPSRLLLGASATGVATGWIGTRAHASTTAIFTLNPPGCGLEFGFGAGTTR